MFALAFFGISQANAAKDLSAPPTLKTQNMDDTANFKSLNNDANPAQQIIVKDNEKNVNVPLNLDDLGLGEEVQSEGAPGDVANLTDLNGL